MKAATLVSAEAFDGLIQTDDQRLEYMDGAVIQMGSFPQFTA